MDVILLERISRLGSVGDVVKVKNGFARNFLLPQRRPCAPPKTTSKSSKAAAPCWKNRTRRPKRLLRNRPRR
ncbi:hypothetical protein [Sphingomonas sp.]|uniref:hypothetical protein n=1 Tax=Sphingomonas sp. TaxID=28214 RepID=UPI003CC52090